MKERNKSNKIYRFKVGERFATLTQTKNYEDKFQLSFGKHFTVPSEFSIRWTSNQQKQMRQYFYNRLLEMELPNDYHLVMDFALKPVVGNQSFCDFAVTCPNRFEENYELNEEFCRELIARFEECLE